MEKTSLNRKHEQGLLSIYNELDELCITLDSNTYIEVPARLRNSRNSLRKVLIECELLENHFVCENCAVHEMRSEVSRNRRNICSQCDSEVKRLETVVA